MTGWVAVIYGNGKLHAVPSWPRRHCPHTDFTRIACLAGFGLVVVPYRPSLVVMVNDVLYCTVNPPPPPSAAGEIFGMGNVGRWSGLDWDGRDGWMGWDGDALHSRR